MLLLVPLEKEIKAMQVEGPRGKERKGRENQERRSGSLLTTHYPAGRRRE